MFQEMHKLTAKLSSGSWLPDLSCPGPEIREGGSRPDGDGEKQKLSSGSYLPALAPGLPGHTSPKRMPIGGGSERASSSQSWLPDLTAPAAPRMNHGSGQVGVGTKRALSTGSPTVIKRLKRRPTSAQTRGAHPPTRIFMQGLRNTVRTWRTSSRQSSVKKKLEISCGVQGWCRLMPTTFCVGQTSMR